MNRVRALTTRLAQIMSRHHTRRRAIVSKPFPGSWKKFLTEHSAHYRLLPREHRAEFDRQTQIFMAEKRMTGVEAPVTDDTRLLVAASGVTLTAGWPGYTWDQLTEVLVYPEDFNEEYAFDRPDHSGQAHRWGVVILSLPALERSFAIVEDAFHVGVHEFAHLLDLAHSRFDGVPSYLSDESIREWEAILEREDERLRRGDSVLRPYGLSAPAELFAVAVEAFFQTPTALAHSHRELYAFLASYFRQDPAAWSLSLGR
jgi:Mlc titration factor MtfA (ptsG expression regulator)